MKNRYFIRSRISEKKFREIIKLFSADLTATQIAFLSGVSRSTINKTLKQIRIYIAKFCEKKSPFKKGEIEILEEVLRETIISMGLLAFANRAEISIQYVSDFVAKRKTLSTDTIAKYLHRVFDLNVTMNLETADKKPA